jgi:hypothetical protein
LSVRRLERDNPSRAPWLLLAGYLGCFTAAEASLSFYEYVLGKPEAFPSPADIFVLAGYALLLASVFLFVRVYRASGFPVGTTGEHLAVGVAVLVPLAFAGYFMLAPIAQAARPWLERLLNVAYPLLDFAVLVPAAILLRITLRFRPGRVWTVWGALIAGFVTLSAADILFAYFSSAEMHDLEPLLETMFAIGYAIAAYGAILQHELLLRDA